MEASYKKIFAGAKANSFLLYKLAITVKYHLWVKPDAIPSKIMSNRLGEM